MSLFAKLFAKKKLTRVLRPRQARPAVEALEARVVAYAASTNVWPNPQLVTISFEPDGTSLGGSNVSNLFATMNSRFGSPSAWEGVILKAAQAWAQQTNINFAVVGDSGAAIGSGNYEQGDPTMGDIRIGGYNFGNNTLGQAYTPPPINDTSYAGDIQFNTGVSWSNGVKSGCYDLYTVALHEIGHALGLYHSSIVSASMYANYTGVKNLTSDDIAGIRSIYSAGAPRATDVNGGTNTSFSTAVDVSSAINSTALTALLPDLNVSTAGTSYYYMVTVPAGTNGTMTVGVQSTGLSLLAPQVTVYAAASQSTSTQSGGLIGGTLGLVTNTVGSLTGSTTTSTSPTQVGTASVSGYTGGTATVTVSNVVADQVYYIQVQGSSTTSFGTGDYALSLSFGGAALPTEVATAVPSLNGPTPVAGGGQPLSLNPAFQVPTGSGTQQTNPVTPGAVGMDANGNYVTVWAAQDANGNWGVYGQRYNAIGATQGGVFQVSASGATSQMYPTVAMSANGSFVVTWSSNGQDGSGWGVYAQLYKAGGSAQGGVFRVNSTTSGDQMYSSVAMSANGSFVVAWQSNGQDGSGWGVYAQQYNANGAAVGSEFRVNTTTAGDQTYPTVAMDNAGDFVITWSGSTATGGSNVYAQRYNASGVAQGGEFRVNSLASGGQSNSAVAMNYNTGAFVITWASNGQDGSGWGVYERLYNAQGVAQGNEFQVNTYTRGDQTDPCVAMDGNGNFMVTWQSNGQDGSGWGVYAQQYNANGAAVGSEFRVNTATAGNQQSVSVAMDSLGDAVAVWTSVALNNGAKGGTPGVFGQRYLLNGSPGLVANTATDGMVPAASAQTNSATPGSVASDAQGNYVLVWAAQNTTGSAWAIYGQMYYADGTAQGSPFQVSAYNSGDQLYPSVAMDAYGSFVITWSSNGQDSDGWGVYAQLYNPDGTAAGGAFQVNSTTAGDQMYSSAAMADSGAFVISWSSKGQDGSGWGVYERQYNADGTPAGGEAQVNTTTAGDQMYSTVAMDSAGDFVVTWSSSGQAGGAWGVYAQRYSADGTPAGGEVQVSAAAGDQLNAAVAMNRTTGDFVIAWCGAAPGGSGWAVYAQRYNAQGAAQGGVFQASTSALGSQTSPSVAIDNNGNCLISWAATKADGTSSGIIAQSFSAAGAAVGGEFAVSTSAGGNQHSVSIVMDAQGNATAVWTGMAADGSLSVFSQRLLTDGNGGFTDMAATDMLVGSGSQAEPHGPGCSCALCARLARALGAPTAA